MFTILPGKLLSENDISQLIEVLSQAAVEWYFIGVKLNIKPAQLDCIKKDCGDTMNCLTTMLKVWLSGTKYPTVDSLAKALESDTVKKGRCSRELKKAFSKC